MDIVIELESTETDRFVKLFLADFYIDDEAVASAVSSSRMFNIIHNASVTKLDFIVRKDTPYRREEFANRQRMNLGSLELWVVGAEDLVLSKLVWAQDTGSQQQLADVRSLLSARETLDVGYLARWAAELGVADALTSCRS